MKKQVYPSDAGWRGRGLVVLWLAPLPHKKVLGSVSGLASSPHPPTVLPHASWSTGYSRFAERLFVSTCRLLWWTNSPDVSWDELRNPETKHRASISTKWLGCVEVASNLLKDMAAVFVFIHKHQKHSGADVNVNVFQENKSNSYQQPPNNWAHKIQFSAIIKTSEEMEAMCNVFFSEVTR